MSASLTPSSNRTPALWLALVAPLCLGACAESTPTEPSENAASVIMDASLEELTRKLNNVSAALVSLEERLDWLELENARRVAENGRLSARVGALDAEAVTRTGRLEEVGTRVGALEQATVAGSEERDALWVELAAQQGALAELSAGDGDRGERLAALEATLQPVHLEQIDGRMAWVFTGVNVHIRSGHTSGHTFAENGLGNLVLGYDRRADSQSPSTRRGSHNLVLGDYHHYTSAGGLVTGYDNRLLADSATALGGRSLEVRARYAVAVGGEDNVANAFGSVVVGGIENETTGWRATVTGGLGNVAAGYDSTVSGGAHRRSGGIFQWAAGSLSEAH